MTTSPNYEAFVDTAADPAFRGFVHRPAGDPGDGLVLTHGAGGNCKMALLVVLSEAFAEAGITVLRCDLPFRQNRPYGPPRPAEAARDRAGLKNAVAVMRKLASARVFLGGQSYGGRQASMLCAEEPGLIDGLLLLSYPLHPPGKPDRLRIEHLPKIKVAALFVEGTRDPFGSIEEIQAALKLIPGKTKLLPVEGAGHDLGFKGKGRIEDLPARVVAQFREMLG